MPGPRQHLGCPWAPELTGPPPGTGQSACLQAGCGPPRPWSPVWTGLGRPPLLEARNVSRKTNKGHEAPHGLQQGCLEPRCGQRPRAHQGNGPRELGARLPHAGIYTCTAGHRDSGHSTPWAAVGLWSEEEGLNTGDGAMGTAQGATGWSSQPDKGLLFQDAADSWPPCPAPRGPQSGPGPHRTCHLSALGEPQRPCLRELCLQGRAPPHPVALSRHTVGVCWGCRHLQVCLEELAMADVICQVPQIHTGGMASEVTFIRGEETWRPGSAP